MAAGWRSAAPGSPSSRITSKPMAPSSSPRACGPTSAPTASPRRNSDRTTATRETRARCATFPAFTLIYALRQLPHGVQHRAVHPLHHRRRLLLAPRLRRLASADLLHLGLDVFDPPERQLRALDRVQQVLPPRIDGDSTLRRHHI